jgi:hypothetical protein
MKDLIFLVADKNMEYTVRGLLNKPARLQIREISWDIRVHDKSDPGCYNEADQFLRSANRDYEYTIVMFDHHGSGQEARSVEDIQTELETRLERNGWEQRCRVIVLKPELEIWVWSSSTQVDMCLGWGGKTPDLRSWLNQEQLWLKAETKPHDPKKAVEEALRRARKPRSSRIYEELANQVSFRNCVDPAFARFTSALKTWFSE